MRDLTGALVREGALTAAAASRALAGVAAGEDVASAALRLGLAAEGALLRALVQVYGCPGVDLSQTVVPLAGLDVVPLALCYNARVLPVAVQARSIALAMADPDDLGAADEVRFLSGREVLRYVAVPHALARVLAAAPELRRQGQAVWSGDAAPRVAGPAAGWLVEVKPPAPAPFAEAVPEPERAFATGAAGRAREGAPPAAAATRDPGSRLALVADDDRETRDLVARVVRAMGFDVLHAADGGTALDLFRSARPDVGLVDAMMPVMHGFDVCRAVKGDPQLRNVAVVLCSAVYRGTVALDARTAFGADGFVEKPFRVEELKRVVRAAVAGCAGHEEPQERQRREEAARSWRAGAKALADGRVDEAVALCRAAADRDPLCAEAHYYLGHALVRQGFLLEAAALYERAAELRPDVDAAHQHVAQTYERLGFQRSARSAWTRAIDACHDPARRAAMQRHLAALLSAPR